MIRLRKWYLVVLLIWFVIGLPIYLVGQGFAGPEHGAFTFDLFISALIPPTSNVEVFAIWLIGTVSMLLPVICLPFALYRRKA